MRKTKTLLRKDGYSHKQIPFGLRGAGLPTLKRRPIWPQGRVGWSGDAPECAPHHCRLAAAAQRARLQNSALNRAYRGIPCPFRDSGGSHGPHHGLQREP
jgi:hypothetical protein